MGSGPKIYFVLAVHNHQPVGNLTEVFQTGFEQTYQPFLSMLERFPGVRIALHYSGSLLDWLEENQPDFISRLRVLSDRGQVEMLGGGYYEPILPIIPDEDKIGQMRYMSQRLKELFGVTPKGMWLAERVWEPHLARPIAESGLKYLAVDDAHFFEIGQQVLYNYYRTEEEGWPLDVFPISEQLRYLIPFNPPQDTIDFFREHQDPHERRLFVLADDGEKFGGWPGTYETVYEEGWLEEFFFLLEENRDWLSVVTFDQYRRMFPPQGPVYLPTASYREMKEWSGGFWRNFLTRYPESNRLHKKMLSVSRLLNKLPSGEVRMKAQKHIWAAQCNCPYWHGVFGGLYLNFLRGAVWENLLQAQQIIESQVRSGPFLEISAVDHSFGGEKELVVNTDRFSLLLAPHLGGSLWELSWKPAGINLLDTLTRRPEPYHQQLSEQTGAPKPPEKGAVSIHHQHKVKEKGLLERLCYDPYPRVALIEHFLSPGVSLQEFVNGKHQEPGEFLLQPATAEVVPMPADHDFSQGEGIKVVFRRAGGLDGQGRLILEKSVTLYAGQDEILVEYILRNAGDHLVEYRFAVELNLAMMGGYDDQRWFEIPGRELSERYMASIGSEDQVEQVSLNDEQRGFRFAMQFDKPAQLWRAPVETVSLSEDGLERVYQQSMILPRWGIKLLPQENWSVQIRASLSFFETKREEAVPAQEVGV